jgi:purine-binding chemotaxis protein CheW
MTSRRICAFVVDDLLLGIAIDDVLEVVRDPVVTPVPLAPTSVAGMLNLRGRILAAVDARQRLDLPRHDRAPVSIVIRSGDETVSLLVDHEDEVLDVDESMAIALPSTASPALRSLMTRAYLVEGRTLIVLDPDQALSVASNER